MVNTMAGPGGGGRAREALGQGSVDAEWRRCMVCGSRSRAGVWLPGNRGKVPAGLEAVCLGERQGRDVRLSRCEMEVLGAPKKPARTEK